MSTFRPQLHWQSPAARISAVMKSRASNCPQVSRRHSEVSVVVCTSHVTISLGGFFGQRGNDG
ncbi:hypothetical protein INR49_000449 [Caranx melampygus]|nr:hypothetical protein INR49_000449 [Caranx melampygus]